MNYNHAPSGSGDGFWGCDIRIDVASVDIAGNFRKLSEMQNPSAPNGATVSLDSSLYFFQPTDCYSCYQRKRRSWGSFVFSMILVGPLMSCVAGVGGVCRPRGVRFVGHNCNGSPPRRGFCTLKPPVRPTWDRPSGPQCASETRTFPAAFDPQTYTLPNLQVGAAHEDGYTNYTNGTYCEVSALCHQGPTGPMWSGFPDENNNYDPNTATCGQMWTEFEINPTAAGLIAGQAVPAGTPSCLVAVPNDPNAPARTTFSYYSSYRICTPAMTGQPTNTICDAIPDGMGGYTINGYAKDARLETPNNTDPSRYFYYEHRVPVPNLPMCAPLPGDPA